MGGVPKTVVHNSQNETPLRPPPLPRRSITPRRQVYADPQRFCPMRFLPNGTGLEGAPRPPPPPPPLVFGSGSHVCIGMEFALMELRALGALLRRELPSFAVLEPELLRPGNPMMTNAPVGRGLRLIVPEGA